MVRGVLFPTLLVREPFGLGAILEAADRLHYREEFTIKSGGLIPAAKNRFRLIWVFNSLHLNFVNLHRFYHLQWYDTVPDQPEQPVARDDKTTCPVTLTCGD